MAQRESIEAALASWRAAERQLAAATNGDTHNLHAEVDRCRDEFQRLSAEHMIEWMGKLHEAEELLLRDGRQWRMA